MSLGKVFLIVALIFAGLAILLDVLNRPANAQGSFPISGTLLFEISFFFFVLAFFVGI